jgi:hypothetical protein
MANLCPAGALILGDGKAGTVLCCDKPVKHEGDHHDPIEGDWSVPDGG